MRLVVVGFAWLVPAWSAAAACETEVEALQSAEGPHVAQAFARVAACDPSVAGGQLGGAVKRTGDVESLVGLAQAAIDAGLYTEVHGMLEPIPDWSAREDTARAIGALCTTDPKVLDYVVGLHGSVRDRTFVAWSGALRMCEAPELTAALEALAAKPPANAFDDKYATVVDLYAGKKGVEAIPVLEKAAIASANGGPFPIVIDAIVKAATPQGIGTKPEGAAREAVIGAFTHIAAAATPDQVTTLAGKLVSMGAEDAAASLLVHIYPDRVQPDGGFVYGLAAVETCESEALVHWAVVKEPGKRWTVSDDLQAPAQAFEPRLKCKAPAPYTVVTTPGPVKSTTEVSTWAATHAASSGGGAKLREEATVILP
jgi:hypothetical protein